MRGMLLVVCGVTGLCLGLWLVLVDYPTASGSLIFDAYDPVRHRMSALTVSPWGLAARGVLFLGCIIGAIWSAWSLRRRK